MLGVEKYSEQVARWPKTGRHILAQFDDTTVVVYQAYNSAIGKYVAQHGRFGSNFSLSRMSWIKPNFLWMMYRSGWGTKENQEVTLALRIRRTFFDEILTAAVPSSWDREGFATETDWSKAVSASSVRLQWDPDHHPSGAKLERRAIQLGLRGDTLKGFASSELIEVIDLSDFVEEQRALFLAGGENALTIPTEQVYHPSSLAMAPYLRLDALNSGELSKIDDAR